MIAILVDVLILSAPLEALFFWVYQAENDLWQYLTQVIAIERRKPEHFSVDPIGGTHYYRIPIGPCQLIKFEAALR